MTLWRKRLIFVLGNCLLLVLSACSLAGGSDAADPAAATATLGSDVVLEPGDATLVCSASCGDRAQCGQTPDALNAVLLSTAGPTVRGHDIWQLDNTTVTITASQPRTVQKQQSSEQYSVEFYQVTLADQRAAWVAGWCIQR